MQLLHETGKEMYRLIEYVYIKNKERKIMNEVWLVYVIYQFDGYDNTEVYSTKEKAINAADQLIFEFEENGYKVAEGFEDVTFEEVFHLDIDSDVMYIRLTDGNGEVEITVEKKIVR